jgi:hypothetical protein
MERYRRERTRLEVDPRGRNHSLPNKQLTTTLIQPRRLPARRYPREPHLRLGRTHTLRGEWSLGSHNMQPLRVQTLFSRQAWHGSVEIYRRPEAFE